MITHLYIAPAASGKTTFMLNHVHRMAKDAPGSVRVCVSSTLQAQAWRQGLATLGGGLGVRIQTLDDFYAECLNATGIGITRLSEPAQYRLLQKIIAEIPLTHYAELRRFPGFIHLLQDFIATVKAASITPKNFSVSAGDTPRLQELAAIYDRYQNYLHEKTWADAVEMGLCATQYASNLTFPESLLVVDGFDNFNAVQLSFLAAIAPKMPEMVITLTGQMAGPSRPLVHQRFDKTRRRVEENFGITAEILPETVSPASAVQTQLESQLFAPHTLPIPNDDTLTLIETGDRLAEVRAALRWLKSRIVFDDIPANQLALLARNIGTYLPHIRQIATEFGLPVWIFKTEPLQANPLIAALLNLLRLTLPLTAEYTERAFPYRLTVQAWRAPYFDWSRAEIAGEAVGIAAGDAVILDAIARDGQVLGGENRWRETLKRLANRPERPNGFDEELLAVSLPSAVEAADFATKFDRFARYLLPPAHADTFTAFVHWLETLIGDDQNATPESLGIVSQSQSETDTAARDISALRMLKEVLRGLVWAEKSISPDEKITFPQFFAELVGAIDAARYSPAGVPNHPAILVADAVAVRGLAFHSVAVLGMAEGEFPAVLKEDPLLRDADRRRLNLGGENLPLSTDSDEVEFFYETITCPWAKLLLTRPKLADNGATWQASAYWEEVRALVDIQPKQPSHIPAPADAASWVELLAGLGNNTIDARWMAQNPDRFTSLTRAADIFASRRVGAKTPFDGDLSGDEIEFARRFAPQETWSASRLESYRACPFMFFAASILGLEARAEPLEGLDARQLGNIYHHIFEKVYNSTTNPTDLSALLARLPQISESILDAAPAKEGFRATAWWAHTRKTIEENVRASLVALHDVAGDFSVTHAEKGFFDKDALIVHDGTDYFQLHGWIDRVDKLPDGTIRIIDYKTASSYAFDNGALLRGKKLQLPLYALAARDALKLGNPSDGFYWHIQQAEPSKLTLAKFKADGGIGADAAFAVVVAHVWEAIHSARAGQFMPHPPTDGCPSHCPAAGFCWHYHPGFGG